MQTVRILAWRWLAVVAAIAPAFAQAQAPAANAPREWKLSTAVGPAFALGKAGARWAALIGEKSAGRLAVKAEVMSDLVCSHGEQVHVLRVAVHPSFGVVEMKKDLPFLIRIRIGGVCEYIAWAVEGISVYMFGFCPPDDNVCLIRIR